MLLGRIVIRPSSLPGLADCERRAAAKSLKPQLTRIGWTLRPERRSIGAIVGTAVHKGVEVSLRHKIKDGTLGTNDDATDQACESIAAQYRDTSDEILPDKVTPNSSAARDQAARMVRSYRTHLAPRLKPLFVESRLEAEFGDRVTISGQSDVMTGEPGRVRDTKTGTRKRANQAQLGTYMILARAHGHDMQETVEDFVQRVGLRAEQPPPVTYQYDSEIAERSAVATINRFVYAITEFERRLIDLDAPPEDAFMANPASALCSEKYCPAHGTKFCREWRAEPKEE
jgi:hypothetical protein